MSWCGLDHEERDRTPCQDLLCRHDLWLIAAHQDEPVHGMADRSPLNLAGQHTTHCRDRARLCCHFCHRMAGIRCYNLCRSSDTCRKAAGVAD